MSGLGAILLAAGRSSRFGDANKLLADIDGRPMVRAVAETLFGANCIDEVLVVTGHDAGAVEIVLEDLPVRFVHNADWHDGMGGSIARGVAGLSASLDGVAIVPGDMPFLTVDLIKALGAKFKEQNGRLIVFPATPAGEQRNPVLWPRRFFGLLEGLSGAQGAKRLLSELAESCIAVLIHDETALRDVDEIDDLS
ncbi:nucleotidyltransferase family protein [Methyloceanibacter sp.]|uniref:nucleotidyltransferase family protein n=1 Tax=Methyloceanibacter sp. TaxID=1965321 RepID=UPI002C33F6BA|nr:nucleotidyltransferase family protein [Methyloceanibacter sp.]HML91092.1 nucleotidyltransferase family protein [Methyloceanibacter sp.]